MCSSDLNNNNNNTNNNNTNNNNKTHHQHELAQTDLEGNNILEQDTGAFGDRITNKHPDLIRIAFQNINLLPQRAHHPKNRHLFTSLKKLDIDLFCCSETGLCWQLLPPEDQWTERARPYFRRFRSSVANNRTEIPISKPRQFGGTAILATDNLAHRITSTGRDPTGLGRWTWMKIQGGTAVIRIISAYRPVHGIGPETVYAQHARNLPPQSNCDPREDILQQLYTHIQTWMTNGEHIILCMDANEDIRDNRIRQFHLSLNLTEAILAKHKNPPATCDKNSQRQPIDAIWVSPGLQPVASGYLPFGKGCPSDHRLLWTELVKDTFLGGAPKLAIPKPRRLRASDPRMVKKYIHLLHPEIMKHQLLQRLRKVHNQAQHTGWNQTLESEYNTINQTQLSL